MDPGCVIHRMTKVLLLEDNPSLRRALAEALTVYGFDVVAVSAVDDALAALRSSPVDVVVTDLGVPGDGASLLEEKVPVIVLTAQQDGGKESLGRGALEALTKPVSGSELCRVIEGSLEERAAAGGRGR